MAKGITKHDYSTSGVWKVYPNNGKSKYTLEINQKIILPIYRALKSKICVKKTIFWGPKKIFDEMSNLIKIL